MQYATLALAFLFAALLYPSAATFAQTQTAAARDSRDEVRARFALSGDKTVYRAGEPVRIVLSFTADRPGYIADGETSKIESSIDEIIIAPEAGVSRWLEQYYGTRRYSDVSILKTLSAEPTRVELVLNDWVRFDEPGRYTVRVKTNRASRPSQPGEFAPPIPLTTNAVNFEVKPMSEAEETQEVRRLSPLIDAAKNWQEEAKLADELSYLTGDPSTREKVRRFIGAEGHSGNYYQNISLGLSMARNRPLVVKLLEQALRDPATGVTHQLLNTLTQMRLLEEDGGAHPVGSVGVMMPETQRAAEIRQAYEREMLASLASRTGKSLTATAMTLLTNLPQEAAQAAQTLGVVRPILVREFENLHPFDQDLLLNAYWDQLRDPALAPALERMLAKPRAPRDPVSPAAALKRLLDLKPEAARPFVVREIVDPSSLADFEVLRSLPDGELPAADAALLEQLRTLAPLKQHMDSVYLRQKSLLAARYATAAIYGELLDIYKTWGAKWQADVRGCLLGYFLRHNETETIPLVEQALAEVGAGLDSSLLNDMTRVNFGDSVDALLRRRLEGDDPQAAGTAAYIMSRHGAAEDEKLIATRLERWRREWGARATELQIEANAAQRMLEINLVNALLDGKAWKPSQAEAGELKRGCVTEPCRRRFQTR